MKKHQPHHPIGIFDSGIGGLTVANAIVKELPKENIIYFGDTAHLPYGDKSAAAIQAYAVRISQMLLQQQCKLIVIACHSASAAAFDLVREYIANQAMVINVIDPVIRLLKEKYHNKKIGLIGTRQTVNSHIYKRKIDELNLGLTLHAHSTNLLASAIEEFGDHGVIDSLLEVYLAQPGLQDIDALLLACTHYPIVKQRIQTLYRKPIEIIDSGETVAATVKRHLEQSNLVNQEKNNSKHFYVSDYTETFAANAKRFFSEDIVLEHYPLWD